MERTLVIIKPDGVQRKLMGEVIERIEHKGLKIVEMRLETISQERAKNHYAVHLGKPFYNDLLEFITSGPALLMVVEGENVVELIRKMAGETSPLKSQPGTIRGDYSNDVQKNIVHTSDSPEHAVEEIKNFF